MAQEKKPTIRDRSPASQQMRDRAAGVRDVMGGTHRMREMHGHYLPQFPAESPEGYARRWEAAILWPFVEDAIRDLVNRVFSSRPITKYLDPTIQRMLPNIDRSGRPFHSWIKDFLKDGLQPGMAGILADQAKPVKGAESYEDELRALSLPYFCHIVAENMLAWDHEPIGSTLYESLDPDQDLPAQRLTWIRLLQIDDEEGGMKQVERIRILYAAGIPRQFVGDNEEDINFVRYEVMEAGERPAGFFGTKTEKTWEEPVIYDEGVMRPHQEIPIAWFQPGWSGFLTARSDYEWRAYMNIRHFQSQSAQDRALDFSRFPRTLVSGATGNEMRTIKAGPQVIVAFSRPGATMQLVETSGAALTLGFTDLDRLEAAARKEPALPQPPMMGAAPGGMSAGMGAIQVGPSMTATEVDARSVPIEADIDTLTLLLEDCVNQAFRYAAKYLDIMNPGKVYLDPKNVEEIESPLPGTEEQEDPSALPEEEAAGAPTPFGKPAAKKGPPKPGEKKAAKPGSDDPESLLKWLARQKDPIAALEKVLGNDPASKKIVAWARKQKDPIAALRTVLTKKAA